MIKNNNINDNDAEIISNNNSIKNFPVKNKMDSSLNSNNSDYSTKPNNLSCINSITNKNINNSLIPPIYPYAKSSSVYINSRNSVSNNFPSTIKNESDKISENILITENNNSSIPFNLRSNSLRNSYSGTITIPSYSSLNRKIKNIYIPKCICLVSLYPFCNELSKILESIYSYSSTNTRLKKPIEKIIENLVIEIPLPPRGIYTINYELFDKTLIFKQSKINELPYISFNLDQIFLMFDIEQTLEIFKHILLETRMIFFSQDMKILSPIVHGFITLIYPFKYPFNYITVIPQENFTILENVTPFIIGINQSYSPNFFEVNQIDISEINFLIIDIDKKKVDLHCYAAQGKDDVNKKKIIKKEFPNLPEHYKNKLQDKIRDYFKQIKTSKINNNKESHSDFLKNIRNFFYEFFASIFMNYSKYLNLDYYNNKNMSIPCVNNLFKVDEFLQTVNSADRLFYSRFILETQQFADFIYKRMIPKDSKEKLEILLFDEHISQKNNRKYFSKKVNTYFLLSELYDFKSVYYVEKQRPLSESERNYFMCSENRKGALKYGQEITLDKDGEIIISYFYFPRLMTSFYFYNNIQNYIIPRNLSEELEQINIEMVSKSHLSIYFFYFF